MRNSRRPNLEERLRAALSAPLPGARAHIQLATMPRRGWQPGVVPADGRAAAALVLLFPGASGPSVVLTQRHGSLPRHGGQVSFPGGAVDGGETVESAALREAREEIGLDPATVRLIGRLTPLFIPPSGFVLTPVVGVARERPAFRAAPGEVEAVLEVPLGALGDPACLATESRAWRGESYRVPFFAVCGTKVWGATAMVLAELLWSLGYPLPPAHDGGHPPDWNPEGGPRAGA